VKNLALAVASILACALAIEGAARLLGGPVHYHEGGSLHFDAVLGFRELPHFEMRSVDEFGAFSFRLNGAGFRGRELPDASAPRRGGVRRIAFVGDSFLVAQAVRDEHLMTRVTERTLAAQGLPAEVFGLASSDYGTAQQLLLLRRIGPALAPDVVVLVMYPHNDLVNNTLELAGRTEVSPGDDLRPYLVPDGPGGLELRYAQPLRAWLRRGSRAFVLLERRILARAAVREDAANSRDDVPDMAERLARGRAPREDLELYRPPPPDSDWARAWETTEALLRAFRDECRRLDARLLVLVIPDVHQVQRDADVVRLDLAARHFAGRPIDALLDWNLPERRLRDFFDREGIEARLLLDPLRRAVTREQPVYARDVHLAWRGHAIAAEAVAEWVSGSPTPTVARTTALRPTPLLPEAPNATAWLDFGRDEYREHLVSGGWIVRRPLRPDSEPGWLTSARALLVLPAREGDLVVRGILPRETALPLEVGLGIVRGPRVTRTFTQHGPFELRLPSPLPDLRVGPPGFVLVEIRPRTTFRARGRRFGLFVQAAGFEPR
jgi:hypothetical protein